ncbi:unnamed protein product [Rhizophagus irregularis]|nr:unnamed protein product [Rhizophagus irregularis]
MNYSDQNIDRLVHHFIKQLLGIRRTVLYRQISSFGFEFQTLTFGLWLDFSTLGPSFVVGRHLGIELSEL